MTKKGIGDDKNVLRREKLRFEASGQQRLVYLVEIYVGGVEAVGSDQVVLYRCRAVRIHH